ncbi:MAG: oxygenase MpaB family protein [Acidobacteriota bacterium]
MKNILGTTTSLDIAFLERLRHEADPPADRVAALMHDGNVFGLFAELVRNHEVWDPDGEPSRRLPEDVRLYLTESGALPAWTRPDLVRHAEDFFLLYGVSSSTLLACASLPECYTMKYGTEVLCFTKFLQLDPARRIRETAQMIMAVMCPGGLVPHDGAGAGPGAHTTQKVRLMHAVIRHMIGETSGGSGQPLDPGAAQAFGAPINQEDLVFTLMTFSYVGVRGFRAMGVPMTARQQDAYIHCWNVVGCLMGVRPELLPADMANAEILYDAVRAHQAAPSEAGRTLTQALMGLLVQLMPETQKHVPLVLTRDLVGDASADMLGVARAPWLEHTYVWCLLRLWKVIVSTSAALHWIRPYRWASEKLHHTLLDRMGHLSGSKPFEIPPEFIARWFPEESAAAASAPTVGH